MTGALNTERDGSTGTLLTNGQVLVAGGEDIMQSTFLSSAELYNPATGTWTITGSLNAARYQQTATLLTNGQVLIAGGDGSTSAELYNPATGTWTMTGVLHAVRNGPTATLLPNGQVLVAGGEDDYSNPLSSAELYNPATGTWTTTSNSLNTARAFHTATLLPNGQVLVAGGVNIITDVVLSSAELYNPATGTWTTTSNSLNTGRYYHTASLLPNGLILVGGGFTRSVELSSAELFNPATGTWTTNGSLTAARFGQTATLLPSGQLLIAGGVGAVGTAIATSELAAPAANPPAGQWTTTNSMANARYLHTATLLPNGQVLAAGGNTIGSIFSAELFNPATGTWTNTGSLNTGCYGQAAILLPNGQVLVAGGIGYSGYAVASAELYNPATGTWTTTPHPMNTARAYQTATLLTNGMVLVEEGSGNTTAELYNPATGIWTYTGSLSTFRGNQTATLLTNGMVLVAGGENSGGGELSSAELYNPSTGTWTNAGSMSNARENHTATLLPNGRVLVAGGFSIGAGGELTSAELYNPTTGTWTTTGSLNAAREEHTATLLPNGQVLVVGGPSVSSTELYNPATGTWTLSGSLTIAPDWQTATLLPNGLVLIAGGQIYSNNAALASAELFNVGLGFSAAWQPQITSVSSPLIPGGTVEITGSLFRGIAEGSGGNNTQDSPADYPVVQLLSLESGQTMFLPATNWSATSYTSLPVTNFPMGYAMVTAFVNGIPSAGSIISAGLPLVSGTVQYSASPTNGTVSLTVNFTSPTNDSNGNAILSWNWDFGDGVGTSTGQYPAYTYTNAGTFTPILTVTNTLGALIVATGPSITVTPGAPVLTWANPASIIYGTALSSNQLDASPSVPGSFAYTPTNGTVLNVGTNTLSIIFTPTDTNDYSSVTDSVSLVVSPALLTVTASNASRLAGTANPTFSGTVTGVTNGDNITATYSTTATINSPAGTFPIVPSLVDPNDRLTNYTTNLVNGTLTVFNPGSGGSVAVYGAPSTASWNSDVTSNISNTSLFFNVSGFLVGSELPTPTLAQLEQYSAVLVYSDASFNDPVGMGNVLADYLDAGGGVVVATFGFNSDGNGLLGRIVTGGYLPLSTGSDINGTFLTLVADQPSHPILNGVTSFNGGSSSYHDSVSTTTGATLVAHWTDGLPLVATKQLTAGRAAALNFYPPSSNARSDFWEASTDGGRLMANALLWAGGGGSVGAYVQFTANPTNGLAPLLIQFNSPTNDSASNAITSWSWNFGDGVGTSTNQNPNYTYTNAGTFSPSLSVTNSLGALIVATGPSVTVAPGTAGLNWATPATITYGTALSASQLNAATNVPGSLAYTPTNGTVLNAGTNTLTVIFTPTDTNDYSSVTDSVSLVVSPALLTVTAANASRLARHGKSSLQRNNHGCDQRRQYHGQ